MIVLTWFYVHGASNPAQKNIQSTQTPINGHLTFPLGWLLIEFWLYYDQISQVVTWIHELFVALSGLTLLLN